MAAGTGRQQAELISLALVTEDGRELYEELSDYNPGSVSDWVRQHVLAHIEGTRRITRGELAGRICEFLQPYPYVEVWADCPSYDWVLFCELFGGPGGLPGNIFGNPFDLQTLFVVRGLHPRVNRQEYSGVKGPLHHALWDARMGKECFKKLSFASS